MTPTQPVVADEEFREFWNSRHPSSLSEFPFDAESPLYFAFERRGETGAIESALILVPFIKDEALLGHHVHLCSDRKSKALFEFCNDVMIAAMSLPEVGLVCAETQGKPELRKAERVAEALGFIPVIVKELGWADYVWNSKAA
jgi:hypothetical protein